jgi:hypothetical protein
MEPWETRIFDERQVNSKRVFIIFCEDGAVEPAYFELFRRPDVHVVAFGNKKQHHAQVDYATEYFRSNDLLEVVQKDGIAREVIKLDDGAQAWCVFDRDKEPNDKRDTSFNDSILAAQSKGIKTAWSNDDFELWILLHFEDVDPNNSEYQFRSKYYERLTSVLKSNFSAVEFFQNPKFDYYHTMKSKKKFLDYTYSLMKSRLGDAIERARALDAFHSATISKPFHLSCPCTKVYLLVEELIR